MSPPALSKPTSGACVRDTPVSLTSSILNALTLAPHAARSSMNVTRTCRVVASVEKSEA